MAFQPSTVLGFQPLLPAIVGFEVLQQLILLDMPQHLEQILHFLPAMERSAVWPWELMGDKVIQPHRKKSTGNIQKKMQSRYGFPSQALMQPAQPTSLSGLLLFT